MFAIKTLIDLYNHKRKKNYSAALSITAKPLTVCLTSYGISCSNLIDREFFSVHNIYQTANSCASSDGQISDTFPCLVGVRQGENLSPLLFPIYLGDLQLFLQDAHKGLAVANKMTKDKKHNFI